MNGSFLAQGLSDPHHGRAGWHPLPLQSRASGLSGPCVHVASCLRWGVEGSTATICSSFHCMNFANSLLHHVYELGGRRAAGWPSCDDEACLQACRLLEFRPWRGCSLRPPPVSSHLLSLPPSSLQKKTRIFPFCLQCAQHFCLSSEKRRFSHLTGEGQRDPGLRLGSRLPLCPLPLVWPA